MYGKHKRKSEKAIICHWYVSEKPVEKCTAAIVAAASDDAHGEDDDDENDDDDTRISAVAAVATKTSTIRPHHTIDAVINPHLNRFADR